MIPDAMMVMCLLVSTSPQVVVGTGNQLQQRSDDADLLSLQTLVQQQAAELQELRAKLTALENQQSANGAFLVDLKLHRQKQAAFSATFSDVQYSLNIGNNAPILYDHVITNVGNGYSPSTGQFVAPFSGVYAFFCNLRSDNAHNWQSIRIYKGGQLLVQATVNGREDPYDKGSAYVTVHLYHGESVHVQHTAGDTYLESGPFATFTGMLTSAD